MRIFILALAVSLLAAGCASKTYVATEIEASESRTQEQINDLKRVVEETQTEIRNLSEELDVKIDGLEGATNALSRRADDNAAMIAKLGHITFKKTLSDAEAYFKTDSAKLNENAMTELNKFAELIKRQNKMVHLEIQGHTDSRGPSSWNRTLGERRASSVRDYLYREHDIPLHLMNVISMGSGQPVADNDTREGRAKNRRVVLIVRIKV